MHRKGSASGRDPNRGSYSCKHTCEEPRIGNGKICSIVVTVRIYAAFSFRKQLQNILNAFTLLSLINLVRSILIRVKRTWYLGP